MCALVNTLNRETRENLLPQRFSAGKRYSETELSRQFDGMIMDWTRLLAIEVGLIVLSAVVAFVFAFVAVRSPIKQLPAQPSYRMHEERSNLVIIAVCLVFFAGLLVLSNVFASDTVSLLTKASAAWMLLASTYALINGFLAHHELSLAGLIHTDLLGKTSEMKWNEVSKVSYSSTRKRFQIETYTGKTVKVTASLTAIPEFATILLAKVSPHRIEPNALKALEAASIGTNPILWS